MWHYFEKGHGKGPCDGIRGAVKRGAVQVAQHGVPLADAISFTTGPCSMRVALALS